MEWDAGVARAEGHGAVRAGQAVSWIPNDVGMRPHAANLSDWRIACAESQLSSPRPGLLRPQPERKRRPSSAASKSALLTLDQKTRISEMITARTPPFGGPSFPVAVDGVVPPDIQLNSLPSEAEEVAPQLRGLRYIVVEELVAIVDPRTRKVEIVFPRWGK